MQTQFETIEINGRKIKFMIDTGATVSLIPTNAFETLNLNLDTKNLPSLETYDGHQLACVGIIV